MSKSAKVVLTDANDGGESIRINTQWPAPPMDAGSHDCECHWIAGRNSRSLKAPDAPRN